MKTKIAVVDLLLAYPPAGGAGVDLFNNFSRLKNDFDIKIFGITFSKYPEKAPQDFKRGIIEKEPPVECSLITLSESDNRQDIVQKIFDAVSFWKPVLVYIADGWTLKPYVADKISEHFKTIVRLYAYEMLCPRNNQKWLFNHKCTNSALEDCRKCLACTAEYTEVVRENRNGQDNPLTFEAAIAEIGESNYEKILDKVIRKCHFIVYNQATKMLLEKNGALSVTKIPGAVNLSEFKISQKNTDRKFTILVYGRMDDRAKGAQTAIDAGLLLKEKGIDFKMIITSSKRHNYEWLNETGWQSQKDIIELLKETDCVLVPSLWEEAFGMTWVEPSAMKIPVIASRIGGPAEYIEDGVTGLLAEAGNPADFAEKIIRLHNAPQLRKTLGDNARKAVEEKFTWDMTAKQTEELIKSIISGNADPENRNRGL